MSVKAFSLDGKLVDNYFAGGFALPTPANDRDKYNNWLVRAGHPGDAQCTDPISY